MSSAYLVVDTVYSRKCGPGTDVHVVLSATFVCRVTLCASERERERAVFGQHLYLTGSQSIK
jgi:hypothetical protein